MDLRILRCDVHLLDPWKAGTVRHGGGFPRSRIASPGVNHPHRTVLPPGGMFPVAAFAELDPETVDVQQQSASTIRNSPASIALPSTAAVVPVLAGRNFNGNQTSDFH
ncbi:hypothetical protein [Saccharopolyspora sp. NPDC002376]